MKGNRAPLGMIVAMGKGRVIGFDGDMPWHFSEDLRHFKRITTGHAVIMGRKTFDSIGRALPGRLNIVVTRQAEASFRGCEVANSLELAIDKARSASAAMPMVIGGATIYEQAMRQATVMFITEIDIEADGDTFFPEWDKEEWVEVDSKDGHDERLTFKKLERREDL